MPAFLFHVSSFGVRKYAGAQSIAALPGVEASSTSMQASLERGSIIHLVLLAYTYASFIRERESAEALIYVHCFRWFHILRLASTWMMFPHPRNAFALQKN